MKKELRTLKIEYAKKIHLNDDGTPKAVSPNGKLFRTYLQDNKTPVRGKDKDTVYLKLYEIYTRENNHITDYSIGNIFTLAIEAKKKIKGIGNKQTGVSKENTVKRDYQDYTRYITTKFAETDIRTIDSQKLFDYIVDRLNSIYFSEGRKVPYKSFNSHFKHILLLIFEYAFEHKFIECTLVDSHKFDAENFSDLLDYTKKSSEEKAFSEYEMNAMTSETRNRIEDYRKKSKIYTNGYMFILSKLTGMRVAELPSLKKIDVNLIKKHIHVHSQQLKSKTNNTYEYCPRTKNETRGSNGGRYVPLTDEACELLKDLFDMQEKLGIKSEWVFCDEDGNWIKKDQYANFLRRLSSKFGFVLTNNHAIRMYFNSYVLIPNGVDAPERAKILGHSVEVNLKHYTYANRDYCEETRQKINKTG